MFRNSSMRFVECAVTFALLMWASPFVGQAADLQPKKEVFALHRDHLGSIRAVTDVSGRLVARHTYWPFGKEAPVAYSPSDRRFIGGEWDQAFDMIYLHARYLDPREGRFTSPDPLLGNRFWPETLNRYAYAVNSPISHADPSGLEWVCIEVPGRSEPFCYEYVEVVAELPEVEVEFEFPDYYDPFRYHFRFPKRFTRVLIDPRLELASLLQVIPAQERTGRDLEDLYDTFCREYPEDPDCLRVFCALHPSSCNRSGRRLEINALTWDGRTPCSVHLDTWIARVLAAYALGQAEEEFFRRRGAGVGDVMHFVSSGAQGAAECLGSQRPNLITPVMGR